MGDFQWKSWSSPFVVDIQNHTLAVTFCIYLKCEIGDEMWAWHSLGTGNEACGQRVASEACTLAE